jgi:hypothetical protein
MLHILKIMPHNLFRGIKYEITRQGFVGFEVTLIINFKYFNYFCYIIVMCFFAIYQIVYN